jgi:hypothetical protein
VFGRSCFDLLHNTFLTQPIYHTTFYFSLITNLSTYTFKTCVNALRVRLAQRWSGGEQLCADQSMCGVCSGSWRCFGRVTSGRRVMHVDAKTRQQESRRRMRLHMEGPWDEVMIVVFFG